MEELDAVGGLDGLTEYFNVLLRVESLIVSGAVGALVEILKKAWPEIRSTGFWKRGKRIVPAVLGAALAFAPGVSPGFSFVVTLCYGVLLGSASGLAYDGFRALAGTISKRARGEPVQGPQGPADSSVELPIPVDEDQGKS